MTYETENHTSAGPQTTRIRALYPLQKFHTPDGSARHHHLYNRQPPTRG